jgi:glycosyltransferase involved in cell wall biosynthesis
MTRVSVCIPTRNQARYLPAAVQSALDQDVDGMEVLVHDDASTDDTADLLAGFSDARLRVLRHREPLGVAANRNSCVERARGRAIAWLDSDDVYLPGSLAERLSVLAEHPQVGLVHGGFDVIDKDGRPLRPWPAAHESDIIQSGALSFDDLTASNPITTSTVVARRSLHRAAGPFAAAIGPSSSDWDMWLRMALRCDVAYLAHPIARYRQHQRSISSRTTSSGERLRCDVRVVRHVLDQDRRLIANPRAARSAAHAALAAKALMHAGDLHTAGRRREALRSIALAGRLAPRIIGGGTLALMVAVATGDNYRSYRTTKQLLDVLSHHVSSPRYAERLSQAAATEPLYEEMLARSAAMLRRVTPGDAMVATATKWDQTLLWLSGRRGVQFPDRRQMPDGYPSDDDAVIAHLDLLGACGVTHLLFTSATRWWLDQYPAFAAHLAGRHWLLHDDADCVIYELCP